MAIITNINTIPNILDNDIVLSYISTLVDDTSYYMQEMTALSVAQTKRYDLSEDIYVIHQSHITKPKPQSSWESHKKYIDIQILISGIEQMEHIDISKLSLRQEYDPATDYMLYHDIDTSNKIVLHPRDIAIYFPNDAHIGLCEYNNTPTRIYKSVIKLPVELWKYKI